MKLLPAQQQYIAQRAQWYWDIKPISVNDDDADSVVLTGQGVPDLQSTLLFIARWPKCHITAEVGSTINPVTGQPQNGQVYASYQEVDVQDIQAVLADYIIYYGNVAKPPLRPIASFPSPPPNCRFVSTIFQFLNSSTGLWNTAYASGPDLAPVLVLQPSSSPGVLRDYPIAVVGMNYRFQGDTFQLLNQTTGNYSTVTVQPLGSGWQLILAAASVPAPAPDPFVDYVGVNYAIVGGWLLLLASATSSGYAVVTAAGADPSPVALAVPYSGPRVPPLVGEPIP